jgi:hypothetical protein
MRDFGSAARILREIVESTHSSGDHGARNNALSQLSACLTHLGQHEAALLIGEWVRQRGFDYHQFQEGSVAYEAFDIGGVVAAINEVGEAKRRNLAERAHFAGRSRDACLGEGRYRHAGAPGIGSTERLMSNPQTMGGCVGVTYSASGC